MRIGLISGKSSGTLTEALQRLGHEVVLLCGEATDPGHAIANARRVMYFKVDDPPGRTVEAANWLADQGIDGLILGTGTWFALSIAEELHRRGIPLSHSVAHLKLYKDKWQTKQLFSAHGLPTPRGGFLRDRTLPGSAFPLVVKSNIDLFPVSVVASAEAYHKKVSALSDTVVQYGVLHEELVEGNDCTIPVFATEREVVADRVIYWSKQQNYRLEGFGPLRDVSLASDTERQVLEQCRFFTRAIGYRGVCRFDIRIDMSGTPSYLEINSVVSIRSEGTSFLAMQAGGIDYVGRALQVYVENIARA